MADQVKIGDITYKLRQFQSGPGHDWLRMGPNGHRSANAEVNRLVDEIVRLRRWKDEALVFVESADRFHDLLPVEDQAKLGGSKLDAIEAYIITGGIRKG